MALEQKIGVLGIGNLLLGDEGFGVHAIRHLEQHYSFPEHVETRDGGTAGIYMAPFLEECSHLLVIDVIDSDTEPGTVHRFTDLDVRAGKVSTRMSPHQLGLLEILEICRLRDRAPERVEFFCVTPESLETSIELSSCLGPMLDVVCDLVIKRLEGLGAGPVAT